MQKLNIYYAICLTGVLFFSFFSNTVAQKNNDTSITLTRLAYRGGGDWYNDPSALVNLCRFINQETFIQLSCEEKHIALTDETLYTIPFLFLTGHGRISFTETESERLRHYLLNGGFLYADDDYGMDTHFKAAMNQVFPERELVELPFDHGIYSIHFQFPAGLPKIHEHDNKPPQGFGIFDDNRRLMVFYTYETNLSDGWSDTAVHDNPPEKRKAALKMGVNIVVWAFLN